MSRLYLTPKGLDRLQEEQRVLVEDLREQGKRKAEANDGGECWHDSFENEDAERQQHRISYRLRELQQMLANAQVISDPPSNCARLALGHVAYIMLDDEPRSYHIGGYGDSDSTTNPPTISYQAPIIAKLMGKEPGFRTVVEINGSKRVVVLEDIELPKNV